VAAHRLNQKAVVGAVFVSAMFMDGAVRVPEGSVA
jgi:hypothetical protein